MAQTVLHFGAGALGRGLVIPRLVEAGSRVVIADADRLLVDQINANTGYAVDFTGPPGRQTHTIAIERAYALDRDDDALDKAIAAAPIVTTSVQVQNLPRVADRLAAVWRDGGTMPRTVVACENLYRAGRHMAHLFAERLHAHAAMIACPDCVVDRICAAVPGESAVETEFYSEWVVENGGARVFAGPDWAGDVDRLFYRKRYLVNALADAAAFLGMKRGHDYLHEAITDAAIIETIGPLLDLFRDHLNRVFGFDMEPLEAYQAQSMKRLSNPAISRRLDTVARDPWRKLGPDERFVEPLIAERLAGRELGAELASLGRIIAAIEPDRAEADRRLRALWLGTPAAPFVDQVSCSGTAS